MRREVQWGEYQYEYKNLVHHGSPTIGKRVGIGGVK